MIFSLNFKLSLESGINLENKGMALEILIGYFVIVSVNELSFDFSNIKAGKLIFFPQFSINI
jgi:hypothetical protein